MGRFFESRFFDSLNKFADVMILGFFFWVCSIPIFTVGVSMTALYYSTHKHVFKSEGYTTEFFKSFKDNFWQSTVSWVVFLVLFAVLSGDIYIVKNFVNPDSIFAASYFVFIVLLALTVVWLTYHFAYIARFANGIKESFKVSAIFMIANLGWSFLILIIIVAVFVVAYKFMILIIFVPVILTCALHPILEHVFRKYMSAEDLEKEDEKTI